jgi:poly[(R)-3-hydroxyalkanoate] polymerase subunit PhaC
MDVFRRIQGDALALIGLAPQNVHIKSALQVRFGASGTMVARKGHSAFLIVAAPIKRPYIWDLAPKVSAVATVWKRAYMCICSSG